MAQAHTQISAYISEETKNLFPGRSTGYPAPPHRPVREGFPHTVPRFRLFYQVVNQSGDTPIGA